MDFEPKQPPSFQAEELGPKAAKVAKAGSGLHETSRGIIMTRRSRRVMLVDHANIDKIP